MIQLSQPAFTLTYEYAGRFIAQETWLHPRRTISNWEMIYVTQGTIYLEQDEAYTVSKGEILFLTPGTEHGGTRTSPPGTSFYWVHFQISDFSRLGIGQRHLRFADGYKFGPLLKQLLHTANTPGYPPCTADMLLGVILAEATISQSGENRQTPLLRDCAEWIRINSDRRLTVAAVAAHFGYHSDYLCTLFRKMSGISLKAYIDRQRIQYIKNLLVATNYSVKELASRLGWEGESQLNHYFRYHEKISPVQYRNLYIRTHLNKK